MASGTRRSASQTMNTAAWVSNYLDGRRDRAEISAKSATLHRSRLSTLAAVCPKVADLTRAGLERWLGSLQLAPASRRAYLSTAKGFTAWLVDQGRLTADPCARVPRVREPRRVPRALTRAQVRALLGVLPDSRAWAVVMLMLGCGLRAAEVAGLELVDWDRDSETLFIRGKGGHERMVPVPPEVSERLATYLSDRGHHAGVLIGAQRPPRGSALNPSAIVKLVSGWMAAAGVKVGPYDGRSGHALRHTCASDVYETSHDLRTVQEMLGHQHLATTAIYLRHSDLDRMRAAMAGRNYAAPDPEPTPPAEPRRLRVVA
jgi:integrase/recombinase XerC